MPPLPEDYFASKRPAGVCFVRQNLGDRMVLTTYGRSSRLLH